MTKVDELTQKLSNLSSLEEGWDSYDAVSIDIHAIEQGIRLVEQLPDWGWQIVPVADGGIQIESNLSGCDVEIYIRKAD